MLTMGHKYEVIAMRNGVRKILFSDFDWGECVKIAKIERERGLWEIVRVK